MTPAPTASRIRSISIVFDAPVTGFTLADLSLQLDGGANRLPGSAATLTTSDGGVTWTLANLEIPTAAAGTFTLTLAAGAVTDAAGNGLTGDAVESWIVAPSQYGPPFDAVGVAGIAFTTTFVVPAADVQPLTVTVTEYVPASARAAFERVGFCAEEVSPSGPVQE